MKNLLSLIFLSIFLLSCNSNAQPEKIDGADQYIVSHVEKSLKNFDSISDTTKAKDSYLNPRIVNSRLLFSSNQLKVSDIGNQNLGNTVSNIKYDISTGVSDDPRSEQVLVVKSMNLKETYFITQIDEPKEGLITQQILKGHRRISIYNGNGYQEENYIILIQINNNTVISVQLVKEGTKKLFTYLK